MTIAPLDRAVIFECLRATVDGEFISDAEFRILFDQPRDDFRRFLSQPPVLHLEDSRTVALLVGLLYYMAQNVDHRADWSDWISVAPDVVSAVGDRLLAMLPPLEYAEMHVHGPVELDGRFYRLIDYRLANGGCGTTSQQWNGQRWVDNFGGPGCPAIRGVPPASDEALAQAGVDVSPLPPGYDPLEDGRVRGDR